MAKPRIEDERSVERGVVNSLENYRFRYYWDLWMILVWKDLKLRYKNTVFGYFWSVANPLVAGAVLFVAFEYTLKTPVENFFLYLLSGLFPWQFFVNCTVQSSEVFLRDRELLKKVIFPRFMLVLAMVGHNAVHFVLSLPVLMLALLWQQGFLPWSVFFIPLLVVNQGMLVIGLSLTIGTLNLFFRDMANLTVVVTNLWFYATPVIYKIAMLPEKYRLLFFLNPMTPVVELWRGILLSGRMDWPLLGYSLLLNLLVLAMGVAVYVHWEERFAEVV